jgi:hypothetical protein
MEQHEPEQPFLKPLPPKTRSASKNATKEPVTKHAGTSAQAQATPVTPTKPASRMGGVATMATP